MVRSVVDDCISFVIGATETSTWQSRSDSGTFLAQGQNRDFLVDAFMSKTSSKQADPRTSRSMGEPIERWCMLRNAAIVWALRRCSGVRPINLR